jgi:two-component sensor histidine kinase
LTAGLQNIIVKHWILYCGFVFILYFLSAVKVTAYSVTDPVTWSVPELASERTTIAFDKKGYLWVGNVKGVFRFNGCDWHAVNIKLPTLYVRALYFDKDDNLWIGFDKSGFLVLTKDGKLLSPQGESDLINPYLNCAVSGFLEKGDEMYLASSLGILKVGSNLQITDVYRFTEQYPGLLYGPHSMNMVRVLCTNPDNENELFVGGPMGFCTFNTQSKKFTHFPMPKVFLKGIRPLIKYVKNQSYDVHDIAVTGRLVLSASWGGGVTIFNSGSKTWEQYVYQEYDDSSPLDENVTLSVKKLNDSLAVFAALRVSAPVLFNFKTGNFVSFAQYFNTSSVKEPASFIELNNNRLFVANFSEINAYKIHSVNSSIDLHLDICKISSDKREIYLNNGFNKLPEVIELGKDEESLEIKLSGTFSGSFDDIKISLWLNDNPYESEDPSSIQIKNISAGTHRFKYSRTTGESVYESEILYIKKEKLLNTKSTLLIIAGSTFFLVGIFYVWFKKKAASRSKNGQIDVIKRIDRLEMEALQSRMNPHFLFNSLNSIKSYIINNEKRLATDFINDFAKLLRDILHYSNSHYISLENELDIVKTYIKLEQKRFQEPFEYSINLDEKVDPQSLFIPSLILQPFVENAVWHGMSHKAAACKLEINISKVRDIIEIRIKDDGIGRRLAGEKNNPLKNKRRSAGIELAKARLRLMYGQSAGIDIIDLENDAGTEVIIRFDLKQFNKNYLNTESI